MLVSGMGAGSIIRALGIRVSTFERWMESPVFIEAVARARLVVERELDMTMLSMSQEYMVATRRMIDLEMRLHCMHDGTMKNALDIIKAIGKERVFGELRGQKEVKTRPKQAQTSRNKPDKSADHPINIDK